MDNQIGYVAALKALKVVGVSHATGDALRASHAGLISSVHGGKASIFFSHLQGFRGDTKVSEEMRRLLMDRAAAWEILIPVSLRTNHGN